MSEDQRDKDAEFARFSEKVKEKFYEEAMRAGFTKSQAEFLREKLSHVSTGFGFGLF